MALDAHTRLARINYKDDISFELVFQKLFTNRLFAMKIKSPFAMLMI